MIFSHESVAAFLNENFECAWESVRPVPHVEIDFGNGHRLSRTLAGNIATYFCTPEGGMYDLVPGLVTGEEFLSRARYALEFWRELAGLEDRTRLVSSCHTVLERSAEGEAAFRDAAKMGVMSFDLTKARVEDGLKKAFAGLMTTHLALTDWSEGGDTADSLGADTEMNRRVRYPLAHRFVAEHPLARPGEVTAEVYRTILHVDLEDPYLGLAPYVLGGEGGRN